MLLASDLRKPPRPKAPVERRVLHGPTLQRPRDPDRWRRGVSSAEGVGFEPTVTVKPHTRSRRAESSALASLQNPTQGAGIRAPRVSSPTTGYGGTGCPPGRDPGDSGIVVGHPFWSVAVGSCATGAREPSQGRKAAALSGTPGVPQITWPPRSRTGASAPGPIVDRVDQHQASSIDPGSTDHDLMGIALVEAEAAAKAGEVPIGAVVAVGGRVVARRHNEREGTGDPTAHAEVLALRDAATAVGSWRLEDATLVVTLEPCPMCAGAAWAARVGRVVWGTANEEAGAAGSLYHFGVDPRLNHEFAVVPGVRADEGAALLTRFFASRR